MIQTCKYLYQLGRALAVLDGKAFLFCFHEESSNFRLNLKELSPIKLMFLCKRTFLVNLIPRFIPISYFFVSDYVTTAVRLTVNCIKNQRYRCNHEKQLR